jgi:hypothetical protein
MTTRELATALEDLGFTAGYAIRNGKIVAWENESEIPEALAEYVKLDVTK